MRNHKELIQKVKDLISTNKTAKALKLLADEQLTNVDREIIILNSRYSKVKADQRLGILDEEDAQRMLNKINVDLLCLADEIENKSTGTTPPPPTTTSTTSNTTHAAKTVASSHTPAAPAQNNSIKYLMIAAILLLLGIGGWAIMHHNEDSDKHGDKVTSNTATTNTDQTTNPTVKNPPKEPATDTTTPTDNENIPTPKAEDVVLGNEFGGGIIFYIDETKQHGLIMAQGDIGNKDIYWHHTDKAPEKANAYGTNVFSGKKNTERIVAKFGEGEYPAKLCADYEFDGFKDWYLPSQKELDLLYEYNNHKGFNPAYYWSSTEISNADVYYKSFHNGKSFKRLPKGSSYKKQNKARVRPIRSF